MNPSFTAAQIEIMRALCTGKSAKQIADERSTSRQTVQAHIRILKLKTHAKTLCQLGAWAQLNGHGAAP